MPWVFGEGWKGVVKISGVVEEAVDRMSIMTLSASGSEEDAAVLVCLFKGIWPPLRRMFGGPSLWSAVARTLRSLRLFGDLNSMSASRSNSVASGKFGVRM